MKITSNKEKAKSAMTARYEETKNYLAKKFRFRLSMSAFKRMMQSSVYSHHQGERERERRLRSYPSLDIAQQGR